MPPLVGLAPDDAALIAIVGLGIAPKSTWALLSLAALVAFTANLSQTEGPETTAMVITAMLLMLVILSFVRGISPVK